MKKIPESLRIWFIIHFIVDILFAIPLILTPYWFLKSLGLDIINPLTARLVGAALIGIGTTSLLVHKKGKESFNSLLTLKIIWSMSAIVGIILTLIEKNILIIWILLFVFVIFSGIWIYYKKLLRE